MTMVFVIENTEECLYCYRPVRGYIYEHQCRPNIQRKSCFCCLVERGICRYCHSPFTTLKLPNGVQQHNYCTKPYPRDKGFLESPAIIRVDVDEVIFDRQLRGGYLETPKTSMWDRPLPSSEFRGYVIDGEEDECVLAEEFLDEEDEDLFSDEDFYEYLRNTLKSEHSDLEEEQESIPMVQISNISSDLYLENSESQDLEITETKTGKFSVLTIIRKL